MVVSRSRTAPGTGDLNLVGDELEKRKCWCILDVTLDSQWTFARSCVKGSQESVGRAPSRKVI